jgi:hypothetical protein
MYGMSRPPASPAFAFQASDDMEIDFDAPAFSSMEMPDSSIVFENQAHHFDTNSSAGESSSSRPFQMLSSPPTSVDKSGKTAALGQSQLSRAMHPLLSEDMQSQSPSRSSYYSERPDSEDCHFDERGLPSVIRLPKPTDKTLKQQNSVYGTLFTYPDPWSIIGDILSRSVPGEGRDDRSRDVQVDEDAGAGTWNRDSEWTTSFIDDRVQDETGNNEESPNEEPVNDELFEELDFEDTQEDPGFGLDELVEGERDAYDEGVFGAEEPSLGPENPKVPNLPLSSVAQRYMLPKRLADELRSPNRRGPTFDEMFEAPSLRRQSSPPASRLSATPPLDDDKGQFFGQQCMELDNTYKSPDPYAPEVSTAIPQLDCCSAPNGDEAATIASDPYAEGNSLSLLEVPELEERNGKWVGPSLFFEDEDDDGDVF